MDNAVSAIKLVLYELMIDGIKYREKIGNKVYEDKNCLKTMNWRFLH